MRFYARLSAIMTALAVVAIISAIYVENRNRGLAHENETFREERRRTEREEADADRLAGARVEAFWIGFNLNSRDGAQDTLDAARAKLEDDVMMGLIFYSFVCALTPDPNWDADTFINGGAQYGNESELDEIDKTLVDRTAAPFIRATAMREVFLLQKPYVEFINDRIFGDEARLQKELSLIVCHR